MINTNALKENDNDKNKSLNPHQYNEKRKSSQLSNNNNNIIVNYKPRGSTPKIEIDETKTSLIRATYNNLNIDTSKKQQRRRLDINKKFKSNNNNNNNSTEKKNSKDFILKNDNNNNNNNNNKSEKTCHLTFVFDPNGRFSYWIGKYYFLNDLLIF